MPYSRPTLTQLRTQVAQHIASAVPGSDPLLKYSNLGIVGEVQAALAHLHYGYLDWIAQQAIPGTATDEYLESWGSLKGIYRTPASRATGTITFSGTNGTVLPSGTAVARGDGRTYKTTADGTVAGGSVTVPAQADADIAGLTGAWGNCDIGTSFSLGVPVAGIGAAGAAAAAFTGGTDIETDDALRSRILLAFQAVAQGGSAADYVRWARQVAGVTRAWCVPNGDGPGTVSLYFMMDVAQAVHGGFPQGTDGRATSEPRGTAATGDQLAVANYLYPLQPVTALVRARAPSANTVAFTINGLSLASTATKNAVEAAIRQVLLDFGQVGGSSTTVPISYVQAAVAAVPNTSGFVITLPAGNIISAAGALPVLGAVTYP
jgi:uncharacterized phage protein gp47/JayE